MKTRSSRATRKIRSGKKAGNRVTRKNRLHKRKNQKKTVMHGGGDKDIDLVKLEAASINKISFVPSDEKVEELITQANKAEEIRYKLASGDTDKTPWRSVKLLSKLYFLPGEAGLCPDSLNPDDTILAQLGAGGLGDGSLRVIDDRNMPLASTSCGPNGVLIDCQGEYGPNRMNLFYDSVEKTAVLLNDYIEFRNDNLNAIFEMYVNKINKSAETMKLDPNKDQELAIELQPDYRNVRDMFSNVLSKYKASSLSDCGIGVVSFCQTWLREGSDVGDAQFSVMSPHFQTRFFVSDEDALKNKDKGGVDEYQIESYKKIIEHFDKIMSKDYGPNGGGPAFINLDGLLNTSEILQNSLKHQNSASRKTFAEKQRLFKNRFAQNNAQNNAPNKSLKNEI